MKTLLVNCDRAREEKLLQEVQYNHAFKMCILSICDYPKFVFFILKQTLYIKLDPWPHFKDSSDMYSMKDLIGLQNGTLLPQVQAVHRMYTSHVHDECEVSYKPAS